MYKKILYIAVLLMMSLSARAIEVSSQAGVLYQFVGADTTATTLVVTGEMNANDFTFISEKMKSLKQLDLAGASIMACSDASTFLGQKEFKANALPQFALMGSAIETIKLPKNLVEIGEGALSSTAIASIELPSTLTTIGDAAFAGCKKLATITIPSNVTTIGNFLFKGCESLASATLSDKIASIGNHTFAQCKSLTNVTLPASLQTIGTSAFAHCSSLSAIEIPSTVKIIGDEAFTQSGLTEINTSACSSLSTIGAWAFARCQKLIKATFNNNVASIGEGAFFDCPLLATYTTPEGVTTISNYMLKGATSTNAETILHDGVTTIGDFAFMDMSQIASLAIPASVDSIGNNAFEGWTSIQQFSVENHSTIPALGSTVWQDVNQPEVKLYVSDDMFDAFSEAPQWKEFKVTRASSVGTNSPGIDPELITAHFAGNTLVVKASSEIASITIYDSAGRQYNHIVPNGDSHLIDTARWDCHIYIINVVLNNGLHKSFKLARIN